jgi:hypothetical protein
LRLGLKENVLDEEGGAAPHVGNEFVGLQGRRTGGCSSVLSRPDVVHGEREQSKCGGRPALLASPIDSALTTHANQRHRFRDHVARISSRRRTRIAP